MHADKPFRHEEIRQRAERSRANYSADHFELAPPEELDVWQQHDPTRDPRLKPQPGDVFAVGADIREVLQCWHGRIEYGFPGKAATRSMPRILWDAWARNADVQKVAA